MSEKKRYVYQVREVIRVVDGDTVDFRVGSSNTFTFDFGFHVKEYLSLDREAVIRFRLAGINTPEVHGATKAAGEAAKAELIRLLSLGPIEVESIGQDKYGRWLAWVRVNEAGTILDINKWLVENKFAVEYLTERT